MQSRAKATSPKKVYLNESITNREGLTDIVEQKKPENRCKFTKNSNEDRIPSAWRKSLNEISNLEYGWDTFDGIPVSKKILKITEELLVELNKQNTPLPNLVPAGDGSVQLEFRKVGLEIFIENTGSVEIGHSNRLFCIGSDYSKVGDYIEKHRHIFQD